MIVGAGPAGSTLARILALRGVKVTLLDAAFFPRHKPCGESLNPGAVAALSRQGISLPVYSSMPSAFPLRGWHIYGPNCAFTGFFPDMKYGLSCERRQLDAWLLEHAAASGVNILQGARVLGLLRGNGKIEGVYGTMKSDQPFKEMAKLVVGADGIRSVIARALGLRGRGRQRKIAFTAHLAGVEGLTDLGELHIRSDLVIGMAPLNFTRANLTVVVPAERSAQAAGRKKCFLMAMAQNFPTLAPRLTHTNVESEVLVCGPFDQPVLRSAVPGALLIGDAAGYYDPLTGQGIYRAIRSSELAAPAVLAALETGTWVAFEQYERIRKREFAAGTFLQHVIDYTVRHPWLLRRLIQLFMRNPALGNMLISMVGDCLKGKQSQKAFEKL